MFFSSPIVPDLCNFDRLFYFLKHAAKTSKTLKFLIYFADTNICSWSKFKTLQK